ncbi:hypothetical protein [Pseudoduganella sp. RAF53_2]|uniref:hypothetical protein n=1 Tax=unclassified Pseudoduganella TaxID=2637179 RepID=UPI003F97E40F
MRLPLILALTAAGALLGLAITACANGPATMPSKDESAESLMQKLRALEASSTCKAAADCHALPVGERMCGGPSAWLAMSGANLPEAKQLAERFTALRKIANQKAAAEGVAGTCEYLPEPAVGCVNGYCRILPTGPGGRVD